MWKDLLRVFSQDVSFLRESKTDLVLITKVQKFSYIFCVGCMFFRDFLENKCKNLPFFLMHMQKTQNIFSLLLTLSSITYLKTLFFCCF